MPSNEYTQEICSGFREYLTARGMPDNTIRSYLTAVRQYHDQYPAEGGAKA